MPLLLVSIKVFFRSNEQVTQKVCAEDRKIEIDRNVVDKLGGRQQV